MLVGASIACGGASGDQSPDAFRVALLTPGPIADQSWNGGAYAGLLRIRDSLGAMALTLAMLARTSDSLDAIIHSIPRYAIEKRKLELSADGPAEVDAPVAEALREAFPGAEVTSVDGVRLDFPAPSSDGAGGQAWVHVRASNTEPIMRLIAEAPTSADANAILDTAESIIRSGVTG